MAMNSRTRVLNLFERKPVDFIPIFSGMGNITLHGLKKYGYRFADIHSDPVKMANMAASTYQLFGYECAVAPFDMDIEAEALGCEVNYYAHRTEDILYPTLKAPLAEKMVDLDLKMPSNLKEKGRIPVVIEALRRLKKEVGDEVCIGSYVLGPYLTVAQVVDIGDLAKSCFKRPDLVEKAMNVATELIVAMAKLWREAGADYVTIREMGAGPDILSPRIFDKLILPQLKKIHAAVVSPNVLHICGNTNDIVEQMKLAGADAISVEEKNDVRQTRQKLGPEEPIFGNIAGYSVLVAGKPEDVDKAVKASIEAGVNAVWPGCDIWPTVPAENMQAMMSAGRKYGKVK
jgi:[methyl-Co(III) methanol-specific corrinoid protein]:coenzyme M methyltransferase